MKNPKRFLFIPEGFVHPCTIGKYCYAVEEGPKLYFYSGPQCKLSIGNFVSFAQNVTILIGGEHQKEWISTFPFSEIFDDAPTAEHVATKGDVVIGSDVWIGCNVTILSGVTIDHGAIIGAGSVVTKDVDAYTIVAGNPARYIRSRFLSHAIEKLRIMKWWEWEDEDIHDVIPLLSSNNIEGLWQVYCHKMEMRENENARGNKN